MSESPQNHIGSCSSVVEFKRRGRLILTTLYRTKKEKKFETQAREVALHRIIVPEIMNTLFSQSRYSREVSGVLSLHDFLLSESRSLSIPLSALVHVIQSVDWSKQYTNTALSYHILDTLKDSSLLSYPLIRMQCEQGKFDCLAKKILQLKTIPLQIFTIREQLYNFISRKNIYITTRQSVAKDMIYYARHELTESIAICEQFGLDITEDGLISIILEALFSYREGETL